MSVITRLIKFLQVGVGISNTDLEYAESTSQTTAPTEGWQTTAPKWRKEYYIWSRTHIYYTDGNEKVSTPMCLSVARSIDRIEECYYSSTSSTAITGGAWVNGKSPTWVSGRYIWTKSIIYFTDGTSTETTPICCTGSQGPQGPQGKPGADGKDGTSISIDGDASGIYANCAALQAAIDKDPTMWKLDDFPMLVNTSSDANKLKVAHDSGYSTPSIISIEARSSGGFYYVISNANKGACYIYDGNIYHNNGSEWRDLGQIQGPQGEPGKPGTNAVQYYYHIAWCNTPDNSDNSFSTSCSDGDQYAYMGTCITANTDKDPEDFSAYTWNKVKGEQGKPGASAVGIQLSMAAIVHKRSKFVSTYSIEVKALKDGVLQDIKSSIHFSQSMVIGVIPKKTVKGKIETITVYINANISANVDLIYEATVDGQTYSYTIPIQTVEDGEPGAKGETGATLRGPQSWENCGNGYSFECGASGEEWKDVVFYNSGYYSCIKSHIKSADNYPGSDDDKNNHYWRLGSPIELVVAKIILAQYQLVENLGVKVIEMEDKNGNIVFLAKDGKVICKGGIFQNVSVSGDITVGRLRYNENTVTDGTSVINGSFIRGGGTYVLPHLSDGEFMRIVVFNPVITRSTPPSVLKGEQEKDAFMAAGSSFFLNRETTIEVYGWCELIGTSRNGQTIWVYSIVENKQNLNS